MIRISTIFIAICMVLVAASLGLVLYSWAGINFYESALVALTALTFLILYNAVSMRLRDRTDVGGQIADSEPLMPSTEYRIRPSEAATSTMQMAMKIVEMRIMPRATPSSPDSKRCELSINVDSK